MDRAPVPSASTSDVEVICICFCSIYIYIYMQNNCIPTPRDKYLNIKKYIIPASSEAKNPFQTALLPSTLCLDVQWSMFASHKQGHEASRKSEERVRQSEGHRSVPMLMPLVPKGMARAARVLPPAREFMWGVSNLPRLCDLSLEDEQKHLR